MNSKKDPIREALRDIEREHEVFLEPYACAPHDVRIFVVTGDGPFEGYFVASFDPACDQIEDVEGYEKAVASMLERRRGEIADELRSFVKEIPDVFEMAKRYYKARKGRRKAPRMRMMSCSSMGPSIRSITS